NAGTLQLGDGVSRNGTLAGNITDNATLKFANPNAQIYSGVISGGGALVKSGAGTLTLSGANSYSGLTIISNGAAIFAGVNSGNGVAMVADGATVGIAATSDAIYWQPSSLTVGSSTGGSLQFNLGGSITGPNANTLLKPTSLTLNGTTTIIIGSCPQVIGSYPLFNGYTSGTLALGLQPPGILGKLTVSAGTVYYQLTNFVQDVWTAAVNTNWDTVTANWTNSIGGNQYVSGYPVTFDDTAAGASPLLVNITNPVTPNSITVNNTNKAYTIGGQAISGSTGLTKNGTNTLTLTGTNTFTGNINISAGTLEIGGQLGSGNYSANIQDDAILKMNSPAAQTLSGTISGNGALVKNNSGTLTLSVPNSYVGGSTVSNGVVVLGDGSSLGTG
ncbi:MAG TPA: autotransporter-associated beta strand repeat-containing protein, partial [Candidatus Binatia bacterium]|nr:autotransporter-associated beta strand repeat-containing protein [Candidatus Binatia bacterium]